MLASNARLYDRSLQRREYIRGTLQRDHEQQFREEHPFLPKMRVPLWKAEAVRRLGGGLKVTPRHEFLQYLKYSRGGR